MRFFRFRQGRMTAGRACRHVSSVTLGRIETKLEKQLLSPNSCTECKGSLVAEDKDNDEDKNESQTAEPASSPKDSATCLTCFEAVCLECLDRHARERNHPITIRIRNGPSNNCASAFYCGMCESDTVFASLSGAPKAKKQRLVLEKVFELFKSHAPAPSSAKSLIPEESCRGLKANRPRGLVNLGNTCFMNAALQMLAASLAHAPIPSDSVDAQTIWIGLHSILVQLLDPKASSASPLNPRDFLHLLARKHKKLASLQQQDSHDFLRLLFNSLSDELRNTSAASGKAAKPVAGPHELLFGGCMVSRVVCGSCRQVSDTREPFLDLSLSLKQQQPNLHTLIDRISLAASDNEPDEGNDNRSIRDDASSDVEYTLQGLLLNWAQKVSLQGDNGYFCEHCAKRQGPKDESSEQPLVLQPATLRYQIEKLPQVLILHLQRFKTLFSKGKKGKNAASSMTIEKDHSNVAFPLKLKLPASMLLEDNLSGAGAEYELIGYIIHEGHSTTSGHYTAVTRTLGGSWYHVSDTRVAEISAKKAFDLNQYQPYLLFYKKCVL